MIITNKDRSFFNGDSTTDAKRDREDYQSLSGYNRLLRKYYKKSMAIKILLNSINYRRGKRTFGNGYKPNI